MHLPWLIKHVWHMVWNILDTEWGPVKDRPPYWFAFWFAFWPFERFTHHFPLPRMFFLPDSAPEAKHVYNLMYRIRNVTESSATHHDGRNRICVFFYGNCFFSTPSWIRMTKGCSWLPLNCATLVSVAHFLHFALTLPWLLVLLESDIIKFEQKY